MTSFSNQKKTSWKKTALLGVSLFGLSAVIIPSLSFADEDSAADRVIAAVLTGASGQVEALARVGQAIIDNLGIRGELAANKATTEAGDNLLCSIVTSNQVEAATRVYADVLSSFLTKVPYNFEGIMNGNPGRRSTFPSCYGPLAGTRGSCSEEERAQEAMYAQCALKTGGPLDYAIIDKTYKGQKSGNGTLYREITDGVPSGSRWAFSANEKQYKMCVDLDFNKIDEWEKSSNTENSAWIKTAALHENPKEVNLIRADRRMETIFDTLEFVPNTYALGWKILSPRQKLYLAAVNYCYMVAGGAEPGRVGGFSSVVKGGVTSGAVDENVVGIPSNPTEVKAAMNWDMNSARQSVILNRCLQIVAEHTRPVCTDGLAAGASGFNSALKDLCSVQNAVCTNAKIRGVDTSMYGDNQETCTRGLSWAETRRLANEGCLLNEEYTNLAGTTTATQAQLAEHARRCTQLVETYRSDVARERNEFARLISGR